MHMIICAGAPGSGKTTWCEQCALSPLLVVSADHYFTSKRGYRSSPAKLGKAHAYCLRRTVSALDEGIAHVAIDNTNTTIEEIAPYYALGEAYGYSVEILVFERRGLNSHGVPPSTVRRMRRSLALALALAPERWRIEYMDR